MIRTLTKLTTVPKAPENHAPRGFRRMWSGFKQFVGRAAIVGGIFYFGYNHFNDTVHALQRAYNGLIFWAIQAEEAKKREVELKAELAEHREVMAQAIKLLEKPAKCPQPIPATAMPPKAQGSQVPTSGAVSSDRACPRYHFRREGVCIDIRELPDNSAQPSSAP